MIYPNPVKGTFKINFHIQAEQKVIVKLYDVTGRLVEKVFDGMSMSGVNEITIKTDKFCAGIYFISIEVGREIIARKVILFR